MYKRGFFTTIFFALLYSFSFAQTVASHEFVGTLQLPDQSLISYRITFDEYEDLSIKGISVTDFSGSHRTESAIEGRLNEKRDKISFQEVANITTKSNVSQDDFCYLHLQDATIRLSNRKGIIQGSFVSKYSDGSECLPGTIMMMSQQSFARKLKKVTKKVKRFAPKDKKQETLTMLNKSESTLIDSLILKDDETLSLLSNADSILISVWDDQYIDGDKISIEIDQLVYLAEYEVGKDKKFFWVPCQGDTTSVTFTALNEGKYPPNSANIAVKSSQNIIPISVRLLAGKSASVNIIRKKS